MKKKRMKVRTKRSHFNILDESYLDKCKETGRIGPEVSKL